jgi:hypothetical protein
MSNVNIYSSPGGGRPFTVYAWSEGKRRFILYEDGYKSLQERIIDRVRFGGDSGYFYTFMAFGSLPSGL